MSPANTNSVEIRIGVFVERGLLAEFPRDVAELYRVIPIRRLGKGLLVCSQSEPSTTLIKQLNSALGRPVVLVRCHISDLEQTLDELYRSGDSEQKIGEILKKEALVTDGELNEALQKQKTERKRLGEILVDLGLISQDELAKGLRGQERSEGRAVASLLAIDAKTSQIVPEDQARQYKILPLTLSDKKLVIAAAEHLSTEDLAELKSLTGLDIEPVPVVEQDFREALESIYGRLRQSRVREFRLGEVLLEEGLIDQKQLGLCLSEQKKSGKKLGQILIEKGFVSQDAVLKTVAVKIGCEYRRFATSEIDLDLSQYISKRFAEQNQVLMLSKDDKTNEIEVAMTDPANLNLRDILQGIVGPHGFRIRPVLAASANIQAGISYTYRSQGLMETVVDMETIKTEQESEDLVVSMDMPEVKRIINQLLYSAVTEGASDIHIENLETSVEVRFRIDGVLEDRLTPISKENIANVISVLKVDSGLDIAERRRSQDGVFKKRVGADRFIDFRINVHATPFGEDAVIRILDRQANLLPLEKLGFAEAMLEKYVRLVENPQGLILFTGPTGSGKTTTLYSTLTHLNKGNRKIVTAEDPIEYVLKGISQYQVNDAIGNTFDDYARRFLRKDPDIILIGEIRDNKTARACINAAMTGHLVFSTLHTNDAIGVVRRLQNLDVAPSLIGDSLLLVVSQRLARRICPQCKEAYTPDAKILKDFFPEGVPTGAKFMRGIGCESCRLKGYRGRVGLYEFWEVKSEARRLVSAGATEDEIRDQALAEDMRVLLADAVSKVLSHHTTLEELSRVVSIDQLQRYANLTSELLKNS